MKSYGLLLTVTVMSTPIFAGGVGDGGGGYAVVCRDSSNQIIGTPQTMDLYESTARYGLTLLQPSGDIRIDFKNAVTNDYREAGESVSPDEWSQWSYNMEGLLQLMTFDKPVPFFNDIGNTIPPPAGCNYEQIAAFISSNQVNDANIDQEIDVNPEIWNRLPSQDRAALILHELFYYELRRDQGATTSERARQMVANAFAIDGVFIPYFGGTIF